jgi:hypothetical protein
MGLHLDINSGNIDYHLKVSQNISVLYTYILNYPYAKVCLHSSAAYDLMQTVKTVLNFTNHKKNMIYIKN